MSDPETCESCATTIQAVTAPATADIGSPKPYENMPGDPQAQGTLPLARHLTDPAIEDWIQQLAAFAPPMTEDQRAYLSRLLRLKKHRIQRPAA